ncbi:MAG: LptA/OstA family protein [Devosia sp.]
MRRLLVALFLSLAFTANALPQAAPVEITADNFAVEQSAKKATFTGNVVVRREGMTLWAGKVTVDYGSGGLSNIVGLIASGGVRLKTPEQTASGDRAEFNPRTQVLKISGNVTITNASGTMSGPQLVLDLKNGSTTFSGGGNSGRVTGVFTPQ